MQQEAKIFPQEIANFSGDSFGSIATMALLVLMGKSSVLEIYRFLVPSIHQKKVKILYKYSNSLLLGSAKIAALAAYNEHLKFAAFRSTGFKTPLCTAASMMRCRGSMAKMNKSGDSGSPYLNPHACLISFVGRPLTKTLDDVVPKSAVIQSLHFLLKLRFSRTSSRKLHPMESKAFELSNLIKKVGFFFLCRSWMTLCT
jgi:hypothetical protein